MKNSFRKFSQEILDADGESSHPLFKYDTGH